MVPNDPETGERAASLMTTNGYVQVTIAMPIFGGPYGSGFRIFGCCGMTTPLAGLWGPQNIGRFS